MTNAIELRGYTGKRPRKFKVSSVLLISLFTLALSLHSARAEPFGLVVQDAEIAPAIVKIGEPVIVNVTVKNVGKNTTSCTVTTFCGDWAAGTHEIPTIIPMDSIPLSFKLDTSSLSSGVHSIETLIKKPAEEHKVFVLGNLTIEEDDLTGPEEVMNPQPDSTNPPEPTNIPPDTNPTIHETPSSTTTSHWLYLLPVVPAAGAIASMLILRESRKNSPKPATWEGATQMEELEKEIKKKLGINKAKVSLVICAAVLVLAISSLWFLSL